MKLQDYDLIRKTLKFLHAQHNVVKAHVIKSNQIRVTFNDGVIEYWWYRTDISKHRKLKVYVMPIDSYPFNKEYPQILNQFTRNPLYPEEYERSKPYFMIGYKYLKKFKFCNTRIFIHEFANKLESEGWIDLWYPNDQLSRLMSKCRQCDFSVLKKSSNEYQEKPWYYRYSQPLLASLTDLRVHSKGNIDNAWTVRPLLRAIDRLYRKKRTITRYNLFCELKAHFVGLSLGYPLSFALLLKEHTRGAIEDHICLPVISLACTIAGIPYNEGKGNVIVTDRENELGSAKTVVFLGDLEGPFSKFYLHGPVPYSKTEIISIKYN